MVNFIAYNPKVLDMFHYELVGEIPHEIPVARVDAG